jgi:hypothetical protein
VLDVTRLTLTDFCCFSFVSLLFDGVSSIFVRVLVVYWLHFYFLC